MTKTTRPTVKVGSHVFLLDVTEAAIYVAVPAKRQWVRCYPSDADRARIVAAAHRSGALS